MGTPSLIKHVLIEAADDAVERSWGCGAWKRPWKLVSSGLQGWTRVC